MSFTEHDAAGIAILLWSADPGCPERLATPFFHAAAAAATDMPVEIYCFSKINSWVPFEDVQSTVLDYAYAVVGQFGLKLFQSPSGNDFEALGSLTNQKQKI